MACPRGAVRHDPDVLELENPPSRNAPQARRRGRRRRALKTCSTPTINIGRCSVSSEGDRPKSEHARSWSCRTTGPAPRWLRPAPIDELQVLQQRGPSRCRKDWPIDEEAKNHVHPSPWGWTGPAYASRRGKWETDRGGTTHSFRRHRRRHQVPWGGANRERAHHGHGPDRPGRVRPRADGKDQRAWPESSIRSPASPIPSTTWKPRPGTASTTSTRSVLRDRRRRRRCGTPGETLFARADKLFGALIIGGDANAWTPDPWGALPRRRGPSLRITTGPGQHRDKLIELIAMWYAEAGKYGGVRRVPVPHRPPHRPPARLPGGRPASPDNTLIMVVSGQRRQRRGRPHRHHERAAVLQPRPRAAGRQPGQDRRTRRAHHVQPLPMGVDLGWQYAVPPVEAGNLPRRDHRPVPGALAGRHQRAR